MIQSPRDPGHEPAPSTPPFRRRALILLAAAIPVLVAVYVLLLLLTAPATNGRQLRLDEFRTMVQQGRVHSADVLERDVRIIGDSDSGPYWVAIPQAVLPDVLASLQQAGVPTVVDQQWSKGLLQPLALLAPALLLVDAFLLVFLLTRGPDPLAGFGRASARLAEGSKVTFADVAGADEAVQELQEVRDFLIAPQRFSGMGARVPRGVLVSGPPGCGKTLLARAVAGEAGVPFLSISGSDFVELYVGVGAARIRDLFREAKRRAPAIVFIDELDAVGRSRMVVGGQDEREATLNQLLVEMDGFNTSEAVVVLAATNRPDILDPALLRPGRFDRRLVVDQPDVRGRSAILRLQARGKPLEADIDLDRIARRTPGFSGADLANVMNEAALLATRRGRARIGMTELEEAIDRVLAGPERRSRILSAAERRVIAFHEAGHALVAARLNQAEVVSKISIVSRGYMLGYTRTLLQEDRLVLGRSQLLSQLAVLHAGRAAEELGVGETSSGGQDDLLRATDLARKMVQDFGMSERLGPMALRGRDGMTGLDPVAFSDSIQAEIDAEIRDLMQGAYQQARTILTGDEATLRALVEALMERETLEGAELSSLLAPATVSGAAIDGPVRQRRM
jgi:cell division protease FtsH